jgi:diguanylate cyclase (GGDEF)-like protein
MPQQSPSVREPESFVRSLLESQDLRGLARTAVQHLPPLGYQSIRLVWNTNLGQQDGEQAYPPGPIDRHAASLLTRVCDQGGMLEQRSLDGGFTEGGFLLGRRSHLWAILLYRRERESTPNPELQDAWQHALNLLALRCDSILRTEQLRLDVERMARAQRLQRALFAISDCASSSQDTTEVLAELHQIVGRLMYAKNFFIVRYNPEPETIRFLYFADTREADTVETDEEMPAERLANSLTLAMLRRGKPLHGPGDVLRAQFGIAESMGPVSEDWLGVPMIEDGVVRGGVIVQSYDPAICYSEADQTLLLYVAQNIQTALARREAVKEMERRVSERTLALRQEVIERQRGERLQAALFRIAEVTNSSETMESFYATIHGIVDELLEAQNFYIGLLTADGEGLEFPFSVDEHHARFESRKLGNGLSEYVLRTGRPLLLYDDRFDELIATGNVQLFGAKAVCWLGVPLIIGGKPIGLIAVQSYTPDYLYTQRDEELLSFVSFHIANALERRRAKEALYAANQQLEVASQTDPLTGLHNRRYLTSQIPTDLAFYDREHARPGKGDHALVFAVVDIDHFKRINDGYGHRAGDRVLQKFARALNSLVQTGDYIVRWGGEEFLLVFRPMPRHAVPALGERIRRNIAEQPFDLGGGLVFPLTCSIGLAEYPLFNDGEQPLGWEQTVELADAALYWVKKNGRDGWAALHPTEKTERASLAQKLQSGAQGLIDSQELKVISGQGQRG